MKLTGKLKEIVEKTENREEAKEIIRNAGEEAGLVLNDEELEEVSGGGGTHTHYKRRYK